MGKRKYCVLVPVYLLLDCAVALAISLLSGRYGPRAEEPRLLYETDSGSTVELGVSERLQVVLAGNVSTGFKWETASMGTGVVRQLGEPEYKPNSAAVGSGGTFTFTFEAAMPGQALLRLIYHRPFEKGKPPSRSFQVTVAVR